RKVPGYRHRARRLLGKHPAALGLAECGLAPVPKHGKAQPAGSDAAFPSRLWDWSSSYYDALGTYTGPAVGLLVLDIDDAATFRRSIDRGNAPLLCDRWQDLEGALVSCHGATTAQAVRSGRGRGKLIFRFAPPEGADHPLARLGITRWAKTRG